MPRISNLVRHASISAVVGLLSVACAAQTSFSTNPTRFLVCDRGVGSFTGKLPNFSSRSGVKVTVHATKRTEFAIRGCEASLNWGSGETLIASQVSQADIDVMGADLGFGVPVVAFQIKATATDPTIQYKIYSLTKPAPLLRTITGQDYFSAADTRLDGTVEIWTTDAAAINGFDGLPLRAFDVAPAVVLRFEDKKLMDVSSEFRGHYDGQINTLRDELGAREIASFKASDGRLAAEHLSPDGQASGLLGTKIRVLEIVWAYLYSGREQQAWDTLNEMWPASDAARVRAAITNARTRGLRAQVDGVSQLTSPQGTSQSIIYEHTVSFGLDQRGDQRGNFTDSGPQQILVRLPSPNNPQHWDEEKQLDLVIDEAGKVRSARMPGAIVKDISAGLRNDEPNREWIDDAAGWKYIPAFKDGRPKAFRSRLHVFRDR